MSRLRALVDIIMLKPVLRRKDLAQRYGVDANTIDYWVRISVLPKPRYLPGCGFPFWTPSEIEKNEHANPDMFADRRRLKWRKKLKALHASKTTKPKTQSTPARSDQETQPSLI
jgi:hypothetical protein